MVLPVVVVGAGIVGASVAYHLAREGVFVALIDRSRPAGGVTGDSFAWVGTGDGGPATIPALRSNALREYRRLAGELPEVRVTWSGSLTWPVHPVAAERTDEADLSERLLGPAEILELEPRLRSPPDRARYEPGDGAIDAVATTSALVRRAQSLGAEVVLGTAVTALQRRGSSVVGVETTRGSRPARAVVLANATAAPALCAPLGVTLPVEASPALLLRFAAPPGLVRRIVVTPEFEVRQAANGQLLATTPRDPRLADADLPTAIGEETREAIRAAFDVRADLRLLSARIGQRPVPADELPIIGPVPAWSRLYVTVLHSAVTLAPLIGRLAAQEIAYGDTAEALRRCRLTRFAP